MTEITDQDRRDMLEWARIAVASKDNQEHDPWVTAARYILAPDPQIIRTPAELEALDPDTLLMSQGKACAWTARSLVGTDLPAVVVATAEHVRACREALEGETT
ncbi:hypothetical protein ACT3S7_04480 [Corynebacterium sp. AOP34-AQ2-28]|uniref:hypothetical protein n=1 Tax=Corynebacterium sp. AOP34-AQ2-28 TaxID=3457689 RepID=UPI004034298D